MPEPEFLADSRSRERGIGGLLPLGSTRKGVITFAIISLRSNGTRQNCRSRVKISLNANSPSERDEDGAYSRSIEQIAFGPTSVGYPDIGETQTKLSDFRL